MSLSPPSVHTWKLVQIVSTSIDPLGYLVESFVYEATNYKQSD